jgi:hypothetical protein
MNNKTQNISNIKIIMKQHFLFLAVFLLFYQSLFAQNMPPESAKNPIVDINGDPLTNKLDPNGFQQGDWYYTDLDKNDLVRKSFENSTCTAIHYKYNGNWVNANQWEQDLVLLASLKTKIEGFLSQHQIATDLQVSQQIVLLFDAQGNLNHCASVGLWDLNEANIVKTEIQAIFANYQLNNIRNETFILL